MCALLPQLVSLERDSPDSVIVAGPWGDAFRRRIVRNLDSVQEAVRSDMNFQSLTVAIGDDLTNHFVVFIYKMSLLARNVGWLKSV